MAEPMPPLHDPARPDAWAVAYVDGRLSDADRAAFEAHLKTHAECREEVAFLRVAFPAYGRVLMEDGPPRSGKELMELVRAAEARLKATGSALPSFDTPASQATQDERGLKPSGRPGGDAAATSDERGVRPGDERTTKPIALSSPQGGRIEGRPRSRRAPLWAFGAGFAALASAAAAWLLWLQPVEAAFEPTLLAESHEPPGGESAPGSGDDRPLGPWPTKLALTAELRDGALAVTVPREPGDVYEVVALVDAKQQRWIADRTHDPACEKACGPLKLRVATDKLAPGPFRVMALVSAEPITDLGLAQWLPQAEQVAPRWLRVRAYAIARVQR